MNKQNDIHQLTVREKKELISFKIILSADYDWQMLFLAFPPFIMLCPSHP